MTSVILHRLVVLAILILLASAAVEGQYKGEPVKRDRLVKVLRSKQFQSKDIVQIINENGVDFRLDAGAESELCAAGARPLVIDAVRRNFRGGNRSAASVRGSNVSNDSYASTIEQAVEAFDIRKDYKAARQLLTQAANSQPTNPRAFQLLGFLSLYGEKDFDEAEKSWKKAIGLGGAAVLRLKHDHDGSFLKTCEGSLYISRNVVRFESDNNEHTFETTDANIKSIEVNNRWRRKFQFKQGSFKIELKRKENSDFSFAPMTGKTDESKMIIRLIGK
jgi:tetratricopeptide (TPR) repeat protein